MSNVYKEVLADISDLNCDYWITANAGCGKTTKLVARFLFLLQSGVLPENILCITYTNAGANEMKQRILDEIKKNECFYKNSIKDIENRLFISTIHGFCKDFLQKKGIINKNTEVLSSNTEEMKKITRQVIDELSNVAELGQCIDFIAKTHSLQEFYGLISNIIENQNNFRYLSQKIFDNFDAKIANLDEELKNVIFPELWELKNFNERLEYRKITELLKKYEKATLIDIAERITKTNFNNVDIFDLKSWKNVVLTTAGAVRKKLVPKEYQLNFDIVDMLQKIQDYFVKCNDFYRLQDCLSVLKLAYYVLKEYELIKKQQNIITYDDMLFETKKLAVKGDLPKVEYLMLDEAQDTNPISWEIISYFKDEKQQPSKLFVVGDMKQSIYGFQGADIGFYKKYHNIFKNRSTANAGVFNDVILNTSYRSYKGILDFVDKFCNNTNNKDAFCESKDDVIQHNTVKKGQAVVQEIVVDLICDENDEKNTDEEIDWVKQMQLNLQQQKIVHENAVIFTNKILDLINDCSAENNNNQLDKITTAIIVPKRTSSNGFVYQIIEELRKKVYVNIPVELELSSLLFYDLLSILKFSVLQYDDISLAMVLKSRIFNIDDDMILNIRDCKETLWQNLLANEWQDNFKEIVVFLKKIIKMQSIKSIIDEIKTICKQCSCVDAYDEYILLLERIYQSYISNNDNDYDIRDFIHYIEGQGYKNDITNSNTKPYNIGTNHFVFFYTVHGVKGLEFDNVILLDFEEKKKDFSKNELLFFNNTTDTDGYESNENNYFFYKKGSIIGHIKEAIDTKIQQKKDKNDSERKRLLYVAITRAKKRFYCYFSKDRLPF